MEMEELEKLLSTHLKRMSEKVTKDFRERTKNCITFARWLNIKTEGAALTQEEQNHLATCDRCQRMDKKNFK